MSASCKGEKEPGNTEREAIEERNGFWLLCGVCSTSKKCSQEAKDMFTWHNGKKEKE